MVKEAFSEVDGHDSNDRDRDSDGFLVQTT